MDAVLCALACSLFLGYFQAVQADRVVKIGNDVKASTSGVDVVGATFLMNDEVQEEGILFAFSAFFRADSPVRFQIWRPVERNANAAEEEVNTFQLIRELRTIPSVINEREDVYIVSRITEDCTRLQKGDRLGIFFEGPLGSVAFKFDPMTHTSLAHTLDDPSKPTAVGAEIDFGTLMFPYDFSASAYTDVNLTLYNADEDSVTCPEELYIPNEDIGKLQSTTPAPPPTGAPGATGATGERGDTGPIGPVGATGLQGPSGYNGTDGLPGFPGEVGADGVAGPPGATGPAGSFGATGATGARGERGPPGPASGNVTVGVAAQATSPMSSATMMTGLIVWLVVLTIINIIVVVAVLFVRRKSSKDVLPNIIVSRPENGRDDKGRDNRISGLEPEESWMGTLKADSHHDLYTDTVNENEAETATGLTSLNVKENNNLRTTPTGSETELIDTDDADRPTSTYELKNY